MAELNKIKVPSAVTRSSKLDLSCDHDTTMNFGLLQPVNYRHMIKGEKIDIRAIATARPVPMSVPTYGRMRLNIRAFFVPYRLVFKFWDDFYTDTIASGHRSSGLVVRRPYFLSRDLRICFAENRWTDPVEDPAAIAVGAYDFSDDLGFHRFTTAGRRAIKVLHSLGYRIPFWLKKFDLDEYDALGLLCYARVYIDWYCNQNYLNTAEVLALKQTFNYSDPVDWPPLSAQMLSFLLNIVMFVQYEGDGYFNAAWDNPNGPVGGQFSPIQVIDQTIPDGASHYAEIDTYANGTPYMKLQPDGNSQLLGTQYIHDALKKITDYQKRHQLATALPITRYLAQWGVASPALQLDRSIYIGAKSIDINVGDIMSTAETEQGSLGDYAGRGFGQSDGSWTYTCDEFGMLVICASILPSGGFYQGCDRHNFSMDKLDVFQPELDGLSVQAISPKEVYVSRNVDFYDNNADHVFGFTGAYGHYKRPLSFVTGDLDCPSVMVGGDSWHLMRRFDDNSFGSASNITHSLNFTRMIDYAQYGRIFNYTGMELDKFFVNFHFDIMAIAPCRPLFETYDFDDKGENVTVQSGSIVN